MRIPWATAVAGAGLAAILALATPRPVSADDVSREATESSHMMHKLGRGLVNVFTGWVEVPKNIASSWKRTDPVTGTVVGFIKGVGWAWGRTCSGVYDIVTFPLPVPEGYVPLMEPEFVLTDIWGEPIPEFNEFPDWSTGGGAKPSARPSTGALGTKP